MSRQNFLTREVFLSAPENDVIAALKSIPLFASHIRFLKACESLQCLEFIYLHPELQQHFTLRVGVLPLDVQFTRLNIHGEHLSGKAFDRCPELLLALHDFELAATAALSDDHAQYVPLTPKPSKSNKDALHQNSISLLAGILGLNRKVS